MPYHPCLGMDDGDLLWACRSLSFSPPFMSFGHTNYIPSMAQQRYQTQFDSYDGLQTVVCAIENFSPDRFLAALQQKNKVSLESIVTLDYEDVCTLTVKELVEEEQRGEFSKEELNLFAENRPLLRRLHTIIDNFDSYLDEKAATRKKLPAKYIACLLLWAQPKEEKAFVEFFINTYKGEHEVPDNSTVNVQKNKLRNGDAVYARLEGLWNSISD